MEMIFALPLIVMSMPVFVTLITWIGVSTFKINSDPVLTDGF